MRGGEALLVKARPEDFIVEEALRLQPGRGGDFAIYRVTKRLLTTLELQERVATQLGVPPKSVAFPGLKDKRALAIQHFSVRGRWPDRLEGEGFAAHFIGRSPRHLSPGDLAGNRFRVALHALKAAQAEALARRLKELETEGLPNYFDEQRFGSYAPGGTFIGKAILQGDAEGALRAYLAQPAPGDLPEIRAFKRLAGGHWRDWQAMLQHAPRSNHRSVLTFLKDHPEGFRKAVNLITPGLLTILLTAYQSFLWNRVASRFLLKRLAALGAPAAFVEVAGERLSLYRSLPAPLLGELGRVSIPLLHHHAAFGSPEVEAIAAEALTEEGLTLNDLKARLLERAYLPKGSRPLLVMPQQTHAYIQAAEPAGQHSVELGFFLPPGSYATLVLKAMAATA